MGFQIPGPTKGKVQYFVDVYQAVVLARPPGSFNDIPDHQAIIEVDPGFGTSGVVGA